MNSKPTFLILISPLIDEMAILSKGRKPDIFESHKSLKLSFTNICGLLSNSIERESFLESNSTDILVLCKTNLDDSIDSGNFSLRRYPLLTRKDSITHTHGLPVYMKEGLPFARDLYLEDFRLYCTQCFTSFSSVTHLLRLYPRFLMLLHLT